jgi:hypothetical protein
MVKLTCLASCTAVGLCFRSLQNRHSPNSKSRKRDRERRGRASNSRPAIPTSTSDIPSDPGLTHQHNSLAHNIKLYAERLPMFRALKLPWGFSANDLNC